MGFEVLGEFFDADYQQKITGISNGSKAPYKNASTIPVRANTLAKGNILKRSTYQNARWTNGQFITQSKLYYIQDVQGST